MRRIALVALLLWIITSLFPLAGQAETSQSRFASLWTRKAAFSEPKLLALSKDAEPVARQFAALRLAELDPPSEAALAALVQALGDPVEEVRLQALAGLMRIGRAATRVLANALSDLKVGSTIRFGDSGENWYVSRSDLAFAALVYGRDVDIDALLSAYRSAPPEAMEEEAEARKEVSNENEGLDEDEESNEEIDEDVYTSTSPRERIRLVLEQIPPQSTPSLYEALQTDDAELRAAVANIVGRAGADDAVPLLAQAVAKQALRSLIRHEEPQIRSLAIRIYPANATESAELVAALLNDPEEEVQRAALNRIQDPEPLELWSGDPCEIFKESPPALLVGLPDSSLSDVMALTRDGDVTTRVAAVMALSSFGCARPEHATAVADALLALLSDPSDEVASGAAERIAEMADQGFLPGSANALYRVLEALVNPNRESSYSYYNNLLTVLQHIELPEARQRETVDALVTACLSTPLGCKSVAETLSERPAWLWAAVNSLVARYPDVRLYDDHVFDALEAFESSSPVYLRQMERLLDHPEKSFQLRAAVALARRKINPPRVWLVLEEGVRYAEDRGWRGDRSTAARTLASFGESGIERLISILGSTIPATFLEPATRVELMHVLAYFARYSSQAADVILAAASDPIDPAQLEAVQALSSLKSRGFEVRIALEKAFSAGNADVRGAVVDEWNEVDQPVPDDLVERVFADPALRNLAATVQLVRRLPRDDPRRLTLTAAALQDEDPWDASEWLEFAGELGEPGAALLAQYTSDGKELTFYFFEGVKQLDSLGSTLVAALEARIPSEPLEEQERIFNALTNVETEASLDRERLYVRLKSSVVAEREHAAKALLSLQEDPWTRGGLLAAVLVEGEVRNIVKMQLADSLLIVNPDFFGQGDAADPYSYTDWPRFPWPPPLGYNHVLVPRKLFVASGKATLGDIYERLVGAIEAAGDGFEHGLFLGPGDGFSLVARMERIKPDGTPLAEPARWMKEGSPKLSLVELLADLFFEKPGYFRVIVFAVTSDLAPGQSATAHLPEPEEGAAGIPPELAEQPFDGKEVLALVYSFERRPDAKIRPWKNGAPSAKQHLKRAGVWPRLEAAAPVRR